MNYQPPPRVETVSKITASLANPNKDLADELSALRDEIRALRELLIQPREWVSLTDEEIAKEGANCWFGGLNYGNEKFARLIESRLREKNGGGKCA